MNDKEFAELQLRMTIVPGRRDGPPPSISIGNALHQVVNESA
jgi:hypothetical protein